MSAAPLHRTPDPYLDWARLTGFAGHSALCQRPADGHLPLLLQAPLALASERGWHAPACYLDKPTDETDDFPFWTAWVPAARLDELADLRAEHAMSLPMRATPAKVKAYADDEPAPDLVIGVIDNGCAFLNRVFGSVEDPACSRFLGLWRQRPVEGPHADWRIPADFGYGLELSRERLRHWHERCQGADDEAAAYRTLGYPLDEQGRLADRLHGTHVLDIAAGRPQALPGSAGAKPPRSDAAAAAGLVFVDLPQPLADDATGAALDAYILDAVHYILGRAAGSRRVIINLSIGAQAGPHDGGSLIERALDALILAERPRLSICVAAGNGAQERWHAAGMLRGRATQRSAQAAWRTVPGDATDSFMELWASARQPAALAGLTLRLTAPDTRSVEVSLGQTERAELRAKDDTLQALLDLRAAGDFDGRKRAVALVSLAPTAGERAGQPAGLWRIELSTPKPAEGQAAPDYHASLWLQRDTPGRSLEPVLQSRFDAISPNLTWDGASATSHLATARQVIAVGATRLSDGQRSPYSPQTGIDLWASADESPAVLGLLCSGGLSGSVFRISGTSAAAPLAARALANGLPPPVIRRGRPKKGHAPVMAAYIQPELKPLRPDGIGKPPDAPAAQA